MLLILVPVRRNTSNFLRSFSLKIELFIGYSLVIFLVTEYLYLYSVYRNIPCDGIWLKESVSAENERSEDGCPVACRWRKSVYENR